MCSKIFGGIPKLGVPFWGSSYKDYSILGSILGSPYLGKLPVETQAYSFFNIVADPAVLFSLAFALPLP